MLTSSLLLSALVFIGIIFFQPQMPTLFVSGIGVTPLKKYCEYLVILLLAAATVVYWLRMERTGDRLLGYYLAAFIVSIFSELPLAFYAKPFDTYNVLGHINKIIAFFLIYYGVYRTSVKAPYMMLTEVGEKLRDENAERKRAEEALREAHNNLEIRVKERTAELAQSNERLQKEIEDRRKAEEAVRESEQRYRSLFEHMLDGFAYCQMVYDEHGHPDDFVYLAVNDAFGMLTGLKNVIGKRVTQVIPRIKELNPELFEIYGRVASTANPERFEIELKPLSLYLSVSVYSPAKGRFVAVFDDITMRKQAEVAMRKAKDELELRVQERTEELAKSQERLQQLASQLLLAQEKERKRVAVELHDGLLSELAATKFLLEGKLALLQKGKLSDLGEFKRVGEVLAIAIKEARRIMNNLHPSVLDELGLIAAMNWSCGEYQKSYPHIKVETRVAVSERDISESIRVVIYRVLQEALNNFARHGKGDRVDLSLSKSDNALVLMIRDNGQGFDMERAQMGLGIESMRERVEISGGTFQIESVIGQGTIIKAIWNEP